MASWKKVIVSGSNANLANLQVDSLSSGVVTGASGNLTTTTINGSGNIVATSGATGLSVSGSFSGSFFGTADSASVAARATTLSSEATASFALTADSASVATRATTLSPEATASIADFATTASYALTGDGVFSGSFSGSFRGDGSGLTGLPTSLDIAGDSGTDTLDLLIQKLEDSENYKEIFKLGTKQALQQFKGKKILIGRARMFEDKTKDLDDPGMFALYKLSEVF